MSPTQWLEPGWAAPVLEAGTVQVWRARLDLPEAQIEHLYLRLDSDERLRADRFVFPEHRRHYIAAHGALRGMLGAYLGDPTSPLPLLAGPNGKPHLDRAARLRFNLSHSGNLAMAAFAIDREVGVDVEEMSRSIDVAELAERTFSTQECRALAAVPLDRRRDGFYHIWTQKEAYLKARGDGIVNGLDHFDVVADPEEGAGLLADRHHADAVAGWQLRALDPGAGFRGALAWEGHANDLRCFEWR